MALVMYGAGLRMNECLRLCILDVDFGRGELIVRYGKGDKDRVTVLPKSAVPGLRRSIDRASVLFERDRLLGITHTVQELPGHSHVNTTMIYTHVLNRGGSGIIRPADRELRIETVER